VRYIEDFSDARQKAWCIHCGRVIADLESNRDHVPSKSLLSKGIRKRGADYDRGADDELGYLPQVFVCRSCNAGFSADENYLLVVLHAVFAGTLYPNPETHPEAAGVLRSNRHVVRSLKRLPGGEALLLHDVQPFTIYPDMDRVKRIIVKNARGHAYHELGEPLLERPLHVGVLPLERMTDDQRNSFEATGSGLDLWPEVGSRMTTQLVSGEAMAGGWIVVEPGSYRYSIDWSNGVTVRTVVWEYLASETRWDR
jgi:hypothetical protein